MKKLSYIFLLFLAISCSSEKKETDSAEEAGSSSSDAITLTPEQVVVAEIKTAGIEERNISETIQCTGSIELPPQNKASVSPFMNGFVKTVNYFPGNTVQKGAVLATLQHPDFLSLQQEYIDAKSQMEFYQSWITLLL